MNGNDVIEHEQKNFERLRDDYLKGKGYTDETLIESFLIDSADYWDFVTNDLAERGV